uniref:Uncharacterized protein n=1 Tax=Oryza barthii TaxID=65489 RepID=A0A0D3H564_9ORYZ
MSGEHHHSGGGGFLLVLVAALPLQIWKNPLHTAAIAHAPNPATVTVVRAHRKLPSLCAPAQNFAPRGGGREQLCHRASPQSLPPPHSSLLSLLSRHERTTSRWELPLDLRRRRAAEAEVVVICSGPTDSTKAAGEGDDAGERRSLETAETGGSATVRGSLSAAAASRLLRVEGHDRRGRAVDAAGNSSRCRVPTLIYPRRGGDRDDSLDFSPSGRRSPRVNSTENPNPANGETGKLEMPVVAASLACNTIKRVSNCGNVTSESQILSNPSRYKNLSLMRNPRHLGTSDIEKLYDKLRYSKFVKEHSSSGIFSSLFQLKSRYGKWDACFFWVKNLPEVIHQQKETSFLKEFRNPGNKFCVTVVLVYPQPPCNLFPDVS